MKIIIESKERPTPQDLEYVGEMLEGGYVKGIDRPAGINWWTEGQEYREEVNHEGRAQAEAAAQSGPAAGA